MPATFRLHRPAALLCAGVLAVSSSAPAQETRMPEFDLPYLGEPADASMSPREEYAIGAEVTSQIFAEGFALEDPELTGYLWRVGWRIASHSATSPPPLTFFVVRDPRINAFALPGGFMGFNAGLLIAAETESELAGVMAHELAHVTQRHIARTIEGTKMADLATWAAVLAAIIAGSANPDVILGSLALGQAASLQRQINFTRNHELEADRIGIRTLTAAGYDPAGMASFFQRLEQQSRLYGDGMPEILRTHPVNTQRIAEARARASASNSSKDAEEPLEFQLMRARARVLSAGRPSAALEHYSRRMDSGIEGPAEFYGTALAQHELGNFGRSNELLERALTMQPKQRNLLLLQARNAQGLRRTDEALAILEKALEEHPRYAPLVLAYADALMDADRSDLARQYLLDRFDTVKEHAESHQALARAARASNNPAELAYHSAAYSLRRGDAVSAIFHLDAGLRNASLTDKERARLTSFRQEVREALPDNWRPPRNRRPPPDEEELS